MSNAASVVYRIAIGLGESGQWRAFGGAGMDDAALRRAVAALMGAQARVLLADVVPSPDLTETAAGVALEAPIADLAMWGETPQSGTLRGLFTCEVAAAAAPATDAATHDEASADEIAPDSPVQAHVVRAGALVEVRAWARGISEADSVAAMASGALPALTQALLRRALTCATDAYEGPATALFITLEWNALTWESRVWLGERRMPLAPATHPMHTFWTPLDASRSVHECIDAAVEALCEGLTDSLREHLAAA